MSFIYKIFNVVTYKYDFIVLNKKKKDYWFLFFKITNIT